MAYTVVTISNAPLRERALKLIADGKTWQELATHAGYFRLHSKGRGYIVADGRRLQRELGVVTHHRGAKSTGPKFSYRQRNTVPVTKRLCEALGVDPVELGI